MKNRLSSVIIILLTATLLQAQPEAYFVHYGAEDGLPQHTITDILQDQNGFMWFSTWDGLSRFDGYTFTTYHLPGSTESASQSSRIDHLFEDCYRNIWTLTYDNHAYRFNVQTGTFTGTEAISGLEGNPFAVSAIFPAPRGNVWLLSKKDGCIVVTDSLFQTQVFHPRNKNLSDSQVNEVYEDQDGNSWILTGNGLTVLHYSSSTPQFYFNSLTHTSFTDKHPFFSVMEKSEEIWFGADKGMIWRYDKKNDTFLPLQTDLSSNVIAIKEISTEKIVIVSSFSGFVIYNTHDGSMEVYNNATLPEISSSQIFSCYVDRNRNLWIETDRLGVAKFNPYTLQYRHFMPFIESTETSVFPPNFFIFEDKEDRLWIHPRGGGFSLYNRSLDQLTPFYNEPFSPTWMFSNMMHSAYSDKQGNLWMCTRSHGLEKVIFFDDTQFRSIQLNDNIHSTISNDVRPIFEDSRKNIWAATKDGMIHLYDDALNEKGVLTEKGTVGAGKSLTGIAYCITEDSHHNIWIGTKGQGLYRLTPKENSSSYEIMNIKHDPNNANSLSDDKVYSIYEDKRGNIWVGTFGGGLNLIPYGTDGEMIIHFKNGLDNYPYSIGSQIRVITEDQFGNIYAGSTLGLIVFDANFLSPASISYNTYVHNNDDESSVGANDIIDICTTKAGETFIGTFGGGISRVDQVDDQGFPVLFENYSSTHGLPSNVILSLQEDQFGNIWVGSEGGLTKFNRSDHTFENYSEMKRLLKRYNFSENSRCRLHDGRMLFGYSHGMILFDPGLVKNNTFNPYLALVQFRLVNRAVTVSSDGPLYQEIHLTDKLKLKHNQNFFSIEFAALDYIDPDNIFYTYKLDGFDREWIFSGNQRIANYTNLSPGKYLFRVKSTNSDGVWADNERLLSIEVLPPFWASGWAYLIYSILFVLLCYLVYKVLYTFYLMRNKIVLEKRESEIKTRFFTNISHEIRTPLTMIVSPIENLIADKSTPTPVKDQLNLVSKNTNRLLNMVNQILDFQKLSQSPLTVHRIRLAPFVESLFEGYARNAEIKKIDYQFVNHIGNSIIWADSEALEKIVLNLLSNALKYTPTGRSITVTLYKENEELALEVKDTGKGISKEKQTRLFKRFESFNEDKSKPSTGIGLSLVKELVDKHQARITVVSEQNLGSCFTLYFKSGISHFSPDVIVDQETVSGVQKVAEHRVTNSLINANWPERNNEQPLVLVVEDDEDLRQFIRSVLEEDDYEVHEASNGVEGFEKAKELIPDFIVSDIMMPEADGMQLLESVRKDIQTSHILFLLLTAKTTLDTKLEGFDLGADEYITKPFSVSFFKARVRSLLLRRNELQNFYRNRINQFSEERLQIDKAKEIVIDSKDLAFIESINKFIEEHLGGNDYVIEDLAVELGMSRTVFFKKVKGLTGLAPVEYVRDVLLQHAAEILIREDCTIKEVSYKVGMNDAKYFSRCFKNKYRMTPTEYRTKYAYQPTDLRDDLLDGID